ncbi:MAG: ribosome biogenesis GTP-binding protein YihA/YsxC [Beijerinckiaceae bacterium]
MTPEHDSDNAAPAPGAAGENAEHERLVEAGRKLFAGECAFFWAANNISSLPAMGAPEIAFAGRSNVGKSSLLNALTNRNTLARTSNTPGRTQQLNFFALGGPPGEEVLRLVDMPGYGYAAVAKNKVEAWNRMMRSYLRGRATLLRVYILIDARHGLKPPDIEMLDMLDQTAQSYQIVLTKTDSAKKSELQGIVAKIEAELGKRPAAYPAIAATSSRDGEVAGLRAAIMKLLEEQAGGGGARS